MQLWDSRRKIPVSSLQNTYQVTAVNFSDTAEQVISGGIDNDIKVCLELFEPNLLPGIIYMLPTVAQCCMLHVDLGPA